MTTQGTRERLRPLAKSKWRAWHTGFAAVLMLSCSPVALHAETSNEELAQEIKALRAQIREMKSAIAADGRPPPGMKARYPGPAVLKDFAIAGASLARRSPNA